MREQLGKKVGILNPQKKPSRALLPHIDFIKQIRAGALAGRAAPGNVERCDGHLHQARSLVGYGVGFSLRTGTEAAIIAPQNRVPEQSISMMMFLEQSKAPLRKAQL